MDPLANEDIKLAQKIFGADAIKKNLSKIIAPNPVIIFCRNYKDQEFTGNVVAGFFTKFCQDFFPAPTHTGICLTKDLDVKEIINGPDDDYKNFLESEKQTSKLKIEKSNYWAVNTFVLNALRKDPKKVDHTEFLKDNIEFLKNVLFYFIYLDHDLSNR